MTNAVRSHLITDYERMPSKKQSSWATILGAGLAGIIAILLLGLWNAFVLYKLYGWFVEPLGAPVLNVWHVWGLFMIFNVLATPYLPRRDLSSKDALMKTLGTSLGWLLALLLGWIISGWI